MITILSSKFDKWYIQEEMGKFLWLLFWIHRMTKEWYTRNKNQLYSRRKLIADRKAIKHMTTILKSKNDKRTMQMDKISTWQIELNILNFTYSVEQSRA